MLSTQMRVEVAVIDEIQMLRDEQRGWAWTRALLGAAADEIHLCGEPAAIDIVKKLLEPIGESVEVRFYERKSPLAIADKAIESYNNIEPGDCVVCFSKRSIFFNSKKLEENGIKPAVIYGDLPPGTKLAQAAKFNDPDDPCNVLVATDAIGMGLNLNIRRVIFNTCTRQSELLPTYAALQIAGRAGRFGTAYANGVATTMRKEDLSTLKAILSEKVEPISNVGIAPTYDQIETFSFHLPQASFVRLLDLFVSVCSISDHFFICTVYDMRELAVLIDQIPLPLKVRYTFCTSPLNTDDKRTAAAFVKMARRFSTGQALTYEWLTDMLEWPPKPATNVTELSFLEQTYEILDQYMWLSMRFPDMLPDEPRAREASKQLDTMIQEGVESFMSLLSADIKPQKPVEKLEKPPSEKAKKPRKSSILQSLLSRNDISEADLEQLREELNRNKK
uniref:RNA helicase n=1 Tax=Caenorhabditis japonica TaxID=281687 RepID=A0A8R1E4X8_CAEJA